MAGMSIRMTAKKEQPLQRLHSQIHYIEGIELVSKVERQYRDALLWVLVYEKYFYRIGGYASVTVLLEEQGQSQTADIIISGAGDGIENFSFGAGRKLAREVVKALESEGLAVDESRSDWVPRGIVERFFK